MPPVTFLVPSYVMMANLGLIETSLPVVLGGDERAGERFSSVRSCDRSLAKCSRRRASTAQAISRP